MKYSHRDDLISFHYRKILDCGIMPTLAAVIIFNMFSNNELLQAIHQGTTNSLKHARVTFSNQGATGGVQHFYYKRNNIEARV